MNDTHALFAQRFEAARTAWTNGDELAAAQLFRLAISAARSDPGLRRELASALFQLGKLSRKLGAAGEAEAGSLLAEALAISEALVGRGDAALAPVLQELSRLHLQQSQHTRAGEVLERLLTIARRNGAEHPDVATALCDLAFVRRKLGDDAAAETLFRDALRIREMALEPNHPATIGTLERLSETCATLGNFADALALLQRALPAREAALGADHERVRAMRARVTDLTLQLAIAASTAAPTTPSLEAFQQTPAAGTDSASLDNASPGDSPAGEWESAVAPTPAESPEPLRRKPAMYAVAGAAVIVVVIAGLLMVRPGAASGRDPGATPLNAVARSTRAGAPVVMASAKITPIGAGTASIAAAPHADSLRIASTTPSSIAPANQGAQRAPTEARPELRAPRLDVHLDSANMPSLPVTPSGDAILRAAMERRRAADTAQPEVRNEVSRPASAEVDDAHTAPRIIGRAPELVFPASLLRSGVRDGQVVVGFMVNDAGKVDMGSIVVEHSDHELFTAAVRDALGRMRFEPAHTLGHDAKPVGAWVSVPFRFTTKK